jgi:hypothetical protein
MTINKLIKYLLYAASPSFILRNHIVGVPEGSQQMQSKIAISCKSYVSIFLHQMQICSFLYLYTLCKTPSLLAMIKENYYCNGYFIIPFLAHQSADYDKTDV